MTNASNLIIQQLSEIVGDLGESANENGYLGEYNARRIATRARAAIRRYAPPGSAYEDDAKKIAESESHDEWKAEQFAAVVHALRDDYALGGLTAVEEIVHADLFDDFLEMANELRTKGFIGPAAVLAGTVLEGHLRKLAAKCEIATKDPKGRPRSAETLGVDLRKGEVITEVQRKSIAAWYAQRNEGAHGRSENLSDGDVERMIDGVRDFVARLPA